MNSQAHLSYGNLLQQLQQLQLEKQHIPRTEVRRLAGEHAISETDIDGIIDFYSFLHCDEQVLYNILLSDNITDRMQGNADIHAQLTSHFADDPAVRVALTSCTGLCDQGPGLLVNNHAIALHDKQRIEQVCQLVEQRMPLAQWPQALFRIDSFIRRRDRLLNRMPDAGSALARVLKMQPGQALQQIKSAGLRGLGGAGFRTALKWQTCQEAVSDQKFVVCNADEGEPGTFKDRVLLQDFSEAMIEGMSVCAAITGASRGLIYLRGEYQYLSAQLENSIDSLRSRGLLGNNILGVTGFSFDIEIHMGAGAYICGEESALIESLEGKRGVPRNRPPFPATHGYLGKPTVVNNVETFCAAASIIANGVDYFTAGGAGESMGTKLLSISGDCAAPGIYEYPFGTPVEQILEDCGAENVQAVQIAGAAGRLVGPAEFSRKLDFADLATGGSFMVFGQQRNLFEVIRNFTGFFKHESCGFCTPCRVGTSLQHDLVCKLADGNASAFDLEELRQLAKVMHYSSHCGLGATAGLATVDLLDRFPQLVAAQLIEQDFRPGFDLDAALSQARQMAHRDDASAHIGDHK